MALYFARHGESEANQLRQISNRGLRHGLTPAGRAQAQALADRLQDRAIQHVFASPVLRAIETGVLLANRLAVKYEVCDALREYDCGELEGRADAEAWQAWRVMQAAWVEAQAWERRHPGGESFLDIRRRFEAFVEGVRASYGGSAANALCVAHGGLYTLMLPLLLKNVTPAMFGQRGFGYTSCLVAEWRPTGWWGVEWDGQPLETLAGP